MLTQLEGTVASELEPLRATLRSLSMVGPFSFTKLVALMLFIVPKYVVGETRVTCSWRTLGRL